MSRFYSTKKEWNEFVKAGKVTPMSVQISKLKSGLDQVEKQMEKEEKNNVKKWLRTYNKNDISYYKKRIKLKEKRIEKGYL